MGIVTHLPLPWVAVKRPAEAGAGMATSSQESRPVWITGVLSCSLLATGRGGGPGGLSDFEFPSGFVVLHTRRLFMKASPSSHLLPDDVLWVVM